MKLTQLAEGIAKKQGKFERLFRRYFRQAPDDELDGMPGFDELEDAVLYYPIDGAMIIHNAKRTIYVPTPNERVTRIVISSYADDNDVDDNDVHIGYDKHWLTYTRGELNTPKHQFELWKKTNY